MRFREGLLHIYKNRRTDGEMTDPFYLYCRLSDLCSSTYEDKNKVELFYAIDKRLCVFETLIKGGKKGEAELLNSYLVVSELLSEESFKKLIECAVWVMSPGAKLPPAKEKATQTPKKEVVKAPMTPQKVVPVKVERAEESVRQETRTPLTMPSYGGMMDAVDLFIGLGAILTLLTLLMGIFGLLNWIFSWHASWTVWQWLIGIVGGGWLALVAAFFIYIWNDAFVADYYITGIISVIAFALINFIFLLLFRGNYKVIFGCFAVWNIIGGGILSAICFDDVEDEWGWGFVVTVIILLLGMIACLIWL
ncbi:MAG: hypothetical protein J6S04_00680 [Clostridia bacterium]|nr:hypothetical protein [Clostridia bacterium]